MGNEIQNFDPNALKKRVQDAIQTNFGMLIPEEQFAALIEEAVNEFFFKSEMVELKGVEYIVNPQDQSWSHKTGTKYKPQYLVTPFKYMVWVELHKITAAMIETHLNEKGDELKKSIESMFDFTAIDKIAMNSAEVNAETMVRFQRQLAVHNAFCIFRNDLASAFNQMGAYDMAQKVNQANIPSVESLKDL